MIRMLRYMANCLLRGKCEYGGASGDIGAVKQTHYITDMDDSHNRCHTGLEWASNNWWWCVDTDKAKNFNMKYRTNISVSFMLCYLSKHPSDRSIEEKHVCDRFESHSDLSYTLRIFYPHAFWKIFVCGFILITRFHSLSALSLPPTQRRATCNETIEGRFTFGCVFNTMWPSSNNIGPIYFVSMHSNLLIFNNLILQNRDGTT